MPARQGYWWLGSVWRVPRLRSPVSVATGFLLTLAPGTAGSVSAHPTLASVLTQAFFSGAGVGCFESAAMNF